MGFLSQMRYRLQGWMQGRNGLDLLSRDLNILGLALMLLGTLFRFDIVYWLGLALFAVVFFRMFSKNITKRAVENSAYLVLRGRVVGWFSGKRQHFSAKKDYRFFTCSSCKQTLRVPKGRGKIEITCPKCGLQFVKKT